MIGLEISVFENSIIRWVFKVVKEALKNRRGWGPNACQ